MRSQRKNRKMGSHFYERYSRAGLTLGPFAFSAGPQVEQGGALVQQGVGILHTDPVDVVHAKLKLPRQLCREHRRADKYIGKEERQIGRR